MPTLNTDFTGDCTGLISAANNAKSTIRSFDGMRAEAAVSLAGAGSAVSDLAKVRSAVGSAGGTVNVGMDTSGIATGRAEIAGARADVRAFGRDMDSLGGSRAFSLSDGGSIQQANRDLSGMRQNLQGASEDFRATARAGSESSAVLESSYGRASSSVVSGNVAAADSGARLESQMSRTSVMARTASADIQDMASAMSSGGGSLSGAGDSVAGSLDNASRAARSAAINGGGPPPIDGGGGGRGGGGGLFGEGADNPISKAGGALDSGIGKLGMPALVGAAIGVVEAVAPAAIGMMAMNAVVKDTPALAYASGKAMHQLADGIREGSQGATAAGVPAFQALGAALKPLGQEIGQIGAANIGHILGAETSLAGSATTALKALAPTIAPSITAVENLGNAFLKGISNPAVAAGITATANALSTPAAAQAVSDITTAVLTGSSYLAQGATQAVTDLAGHGQGATNVGSGWKTQPMGETVAEHSGGMFAYDPSQDTGQAASTPLPGGGGGTTWNQNSGVGRWATAAGSTLHTAGLAARDFMNGSMLNGSAADELHAAGDDQAARWGAATSGQAPPGSAVNPASAQDLASSQAAAPHGYDKDPQTGALTPSGGPAGGGGWWPGGPGTGGSGVQSVQPPGLGAPPPKPPTTAPMGGGAGGGSSFGSLSPAQVQGLSASLPGLSANLAKVAPSAQQMSSGLQQAAPGAAQLSHGLQQVGQSAAQVAPPMAAVSQHTAAATQAVQNLSQQAPAAVSAVQAVAPAAHAALAQAAPVMQSGGAQLGATASTAVASGITGNQQAACDASQKMMNSAANCAKGAAGISSPSKIFQGFGMNLPEGLALGVQNATPLALAAVQSSMQQVVAAGQAGLQTASPSKTFQQMGAQHAADAAKAYAAGSNARYPQADNASRDDAAQRAQDEKNSPAQREHEASTKELERRGFSQKQIDRIQDQQKQHNEHAKQLKKGRDDAQKRAMEAAGYKGYDPSNPASAHNQHADQLRKQREADQQKARDAVDPGRGAGFKPGDNPFSPHATNPQQQHDAMLARRGIGLEAVKSGRTPNQVMNDKANAALGAGPDTGPMQQHGKDAGNALNKGMADGINKGAGGPAGAADNASQNALNAIRKKTKTHSPSEVTHEIGGDLMAGLSGGISAGQSSVASAAGDAMTGAFGSGVTAASNSVMGIASNSGLAVGYQWARGVSSGADSVLKTSDFGQVSLPQIGSALAKTALGVGGMLGPAGSGASIPNHLTITMGAGAPAVPNVTATVIAQFGDQTIQAIAQQVVNVALGQLADSIPQQVG